MDFTPELSAFQGVLVSADNVQSFSKLTARGGNEIKIAYIINNLQKFLNEHYYVDENVLVRAKIEKMRRFAFYIILNSELTALEKLVESDSLASVIWTLPTIPKCLMSEMLWRLYMDKFIYETIAYCHPHLSLQISDALIDYFKYCSPGESIVKLNIIASALYRLICRLEFFNFKNDVLSEILMTAYSHFQKCVKYFVDPPNLYKLVAMKKDAQYKYQGKCFQAMMALVYECMTQYTTVQAFAPANFIELYQLTYIVGGYKLEDAKVPPKEMENKPISETLDKCNEVLLEMFKALVMQISVDIFCAWSEFEENGKSMQQTIGEQCYKLRTKLQSIEGVISEHQVVDMIQQISRRPANIAEIVNVSDSSTIIENMKKNDSTYEEWVRAVIHKDKVFEDATLIELMASNLKVLNEEESHYLFNICKTYLNEGLDNLEKVKYLSVKAFEKCTLEAKSGLLDEQFPDRCFNNLLELPGFDDQLTEVFNKVIEEENPNFTGILTVFIQNPQKVFTKMLHLACENTYQARLMLHAITLLRRFNNHYYDQDIEPCIVRVVEVLLDEMVRDDRKHDHLVAIISGLKNNNIIPGMKMLLFIVLTKIHKGLVNKDMNIIRFQIRLMGEAFRLHELLQLRMPMLIVFGQIIEVVRWNITTFVPSAPNALDQALDLLTNIVATYEEKIPGEAQWIKTKLLGLHPLNCYYYRSMWNPPGDNFIEIVSGTRIKATTPINKLIAWLSKIICSSTHSEWCYIWDSLENFTPERRLTMFHHALLLAMAAEAANRDPDVKNTQHCIIYCIKNFVHISKYKFLTDPIVNDDLAILLKKIAKLANLIKSKDTVHFYAITMPLLAHIESRKQDYTLNPAEVLYQELRNRSYMHMTRRLFQGLQA